MSGEKTEKPTEQRKKQARKDGQTARTPDLGAWGGMLAASVLIPVMINGMLDRAQRLMVRASTFIADPDPERAKAMLRDGAFDAALAAAPLVVSMLVIGIAAAAAQGGVHVATKLFIPKFSRLNPFSGLKRAFGGQALWEGAKALIKTIVLGVVMYYSVRNLVPMLLTAASVPLPVLLKTIAGTVLSLIRSVAIVGIVLAAADYAVVRKRTNKQISMSKQDIKDEHKKSEGDPQLKGQIRAKQLEVSRGRMMSDVPTADVVMVNPTHFAVALRYDPVKGAPRVVAKGAGAVATKIRERAAEHRVPMVQDVPLTRALYKGCDIGQEIPADFFTAVARVLAFVMMLKAKGSAAGVHRNTTAA